MALVEESLRPTGLGLAAAVNFSQVVLGLSYRIILHPDREFFIVRKLSKFEEDV